MPIAVTGARGQIGRWTLYHAASRGDRVIAVSRTGRPDRAGSHGRVLWYRPGDLSKVNAESLIHAAPLETLGYFIAAFRPRRIVAFSSMSLLSKAHGADPKEQSVLETLAAAEAAARSLAVDCQSLTLIRPSMIYGAGLDGTVSRINAWLRRYRFLPLPAGAKGLRQPVHAADLALAALAAIDREGQGFEVLEMGGGSRLTLREMVRRVAHGTGNRAFLPPVPRGLYASMMRLRGARGISPTWLDRLDQDQVVDNTPAIRKLGVHPREFDPTPADFSPPPWP